jgi:Enoyl-(Acyl carrier protein) reductase
MELRATLGKRPTCLRRRDGWCGPNPHVLEFFSSSGRQSYSGFQARGLFLPPLGLGDGPAFLESKTYGLFHHSATIPRACLRCSGASAGMNHFASVPVRNERGGFPWTLRRRSLSSPARRAVSARLSPRRTALAGFFYITQLAIAEMEKQRSGHIVQITTSLADNAIATVPAVLAALTKGGLNAATKSLAIEYAKRGIRVNAAAPGTIKSPMHSPETYAQLDALHPVGRMVRFPTSSAHPLPRICQLRDGRNPTCRWRPKRGPLIRPYAMAKRPWPELSTQEKQQCP